MDGQKLDPDNVMVATTVLHARRDAADRTGQLLEWLERREAQGELLTLAWMLARNLAEYMPIRTDLLQVYVAAGYDVATGYDVP